VSIHDRAFMTRPALDTYLIRIMSPTRLEGDWIDAALHELDHIESSPGDAMCWLDAKLFVLRRMAQYGCRLAGHRLDRYVPSGLPLEDYLDSEGGVS
jgi:hypothetical protein